MTAPENITLHDCSIESMSNFTFVRPPRSVPLPTSASVVASDAPFHAPSLRRKYARLRRMAIVGVVVIGLLCVTNFYFLVRSTTKTGADDAAAGERAPVFDSRKDAGARIDVGLEKMNATEFSEFVGERLADAAAAAHKDDASGSAVDLRFARRILDSMTRMLDEFRWRLKACRLRDECASSPCHAHAECVDTLCSFSCACAKGYRGNGTFCRECRVRGTEVEDNNSYNDDDDVFCRPDELTLFSLPAAPPGPCTDFPCGANATCDASNGAAFCVCLPGFRRREDKVCVDIDECLRPDACHASATCVDGVGGFSCRCDAARAASADKTAPPLTPDPNTGACRPEGFECFADSPDADACYLFADDDDRLMTVHEAQAFCSTRGASLVAAETREENEFLRRQIRRRGGAERDWAMGATDEHGEGAWSWITSQGWKRMRWTDWGDGQPDNGGGKGEDYLQMKGGDSGLRWNDVGNEEMNFICEYIWKERGMP